MALEDLTGPSKYISNLVPSNPPGTDPLSQADDHITGIKNVLINSFPNITGAVTMTQGQLNGTEATVTPTAAPGDNSTTKANTAFVAAAVAAIPPTPSVGVGQTWQDVKATRAFNTDYTNSTGKPIMVSACTTNSSQNVGFNVIVGGVTIYTDPGTASVSNGCTFLVPNGAIYRINCARNLGTWAELR